MGESGAALVRTRMFWEVVGRALGAAAKICGSLAVVAAFVGTVWLLTYVVMRPGHVGNLGDRAIASLAFPAAACGVFVLVIIVGNIAMSGVAYFQLNGRRVRRGARPWSPATRVEFILFTSLAVATFEVLAVGEAGFHGGMWTMFVALALAVAATLPATRARYRGQWREARPTVVASIAAALVWTTSLIIVDGLVKMLLDERAEGSMLAVQIGLFLAIVLLSALMNFRIAVNGYGWLLAAAVVVVGLLLVGALRPLSALPFRYMHYDDYRTTLISTEKGASFLASVERRCSRVTRAGADEYTLTVLSSLGDDYVVLCNPNEWIRVPKPDIESERGGF
ncbi:MAG TPA: hypothetical protein VHS78_06750 [Candidatus Elarobacter sp.]|nr:hypothetical protein [Candidatus Elarobacter sp.]